VFPVEEILRKIAQAVNASMHQNFIFYAVARTLSSFGYQEQRREWVTTA
jgi:ABC-type antimicrobial peptide transport system permease subunit